MILFVYHLDRDTPVVGRNIIMPGHIAKSSGPDPDPLPWLAVSEELKKKLMTKPYDAKKSCWVPDKSSGGFLEGLIQEKDGEKVSVEILETKEVSGAKIFQINAMPFQCI